MELDATSGYYRVRVVDAFAFHFIWSNSIDIVLHRICPGFSYFETISDVCIHLTNIIISVEWIDFILFKYGKIATC